ncbi:hypothetical protein KEM52_006451 [Ascosphaera acerosa]|nr:hypothetical protein KEM52_006451 [Ascosphaera acerosa]
MVNKAALIVIDGWGIAGPESPASGNAIAAAATPNMDKYRAAAAGYTELAASSLAVGLPEGLMGNSEVGHLNIGAGRVVWQDVVRIDQTMKKGEMARVPNVVAAFKRAAQGNGRLHLLGLLSDGGVHAHIAHLFCLLDVAKQLGVRHVFVHCFGDGRDTDPKSGAGFVRRLQDKMAATGVGQVATVVGRYYAMDRDKRWERVAVALDGIVRGEGEGVTEATDPVAAIEQRYEAGETDEFLKPIVLGGQAARVRDGDTCFFFNYRSDRVREIVQLLGGVDRSVMPASHAGFPFPRDVHLTTMTQYKTDFPFPIAFPPQHMGNVLAEWLATQRLRQCHIAETEKYAHVTFFFNGGVEKQFPGEERELIPSPRVATYDLQPTMSAFAVAEKMAERLEHGGFDFVMNNFAPPDMVGHTGVYEAAVKGCEETDRAIGHVLEACKRAGYILFITADHGNAEEMKTEQGTPKTSHTCNKVPFVMLNAPAGWSLAKQEGVLGDVAPTLLAAMGVAQPPEMTGKSLLVKG